MREAEVSLRPSAVQFGAIDFIAMERSGYQTLYHGVHRGNTEENQNHLATMHTNKHEFKNRDTS